MKKILFPFFAVLFFCQIEHAQETLFQAGHTHDILEVHFSPDDSQLVSYSAGDGRFILWDVKSGRQIWTRKTSFIRKADERINLKEFHWSKDGKTLVTKSVNGTFQTWDANTGKVLALTETKPEIELITPDKKQVSYTKDYNNIIFSENGETKQFNRFGNNSAFDTSNNGEMFAEGKGWGDASIKITEIKTGKSWFLDGHPSVIGRIAFSPDGKFLVAGGSDRNIYVFDIVSKQLIEKIGRNSKPIISLAISPNGEKLISAERNGFLRVWDWQPKSRIKEIEFEFPFGANIVKYSPDGKYVLIARDANGMELYDATSWQQVRTFCANEEDSGYECGHKVVSMDFSNDGKLIFAGYENGTVRIWNLKQKRFLKKIKYGNEENYVAAFGNGSKFIAASNEEDKPIKLFDSNTDRELSRFNNPDFDGYVNNLVLSPKEKYFVTSGIGGDVYLWNINKSKPVREFDIGFSGDDAIAFSPDGKTFAIGGRNQNLFLFDVETGEKLWQLIPSYQPSELEIELEARGDKGRAEVAARKVERNKQAEIYASENKNKITAEFSHYGDAESFWDQKIAESGAANKSKLKLPKEKASVAWFTLTSAADLPVSIETNSMIFNPKCQGLCNDAEISLRYVMELKAGETRVNGFDMFSKTILPAKTTAYFSVALADFAASKRIYLGFTFQKNNADDENSDDYGTEQKLYLRETDLPK